MILLSEKVIVSYYRQLTASERFLLNQLRARRGGTAVLVFAQRCQRLKCIAELTVPHFHN